MFAPFENPYLSPRLVQKKRPPSQKVRGLRMRRFWQRRGMIFVACILWIVLIDEYLVRFLPRTAYFGCKSICFGLGAFVACSTVRFAWIVGKPGKTRACDWSPRNEVMGALMVVAFRLAPFPELSCCSFGFGGPVLVTDHLARLAVFAPPIAIGLIFTFVRNNRIAGILSAIATIALCVLHRLNNDWMY